MGNEQKRGLDLPEGSNTRDMRIEVNNILIDKAKTKKDGVYSYKGYLYAVKKNRFIAYADCFGNISSIHGVFHYMLGKAERHDRRKKLIEYLTSINQ